MLSFKKFLGEDTSQSFYNDLIEELNPAQKTVVDSWGGGQRAKEISSNVIPANKDKLTVPFEAPQAPAEPHPAVADHLEKNGFKISDYRNGRAIEPKYGREVRIGKALQDTGASKEILNTFNNDPNRAASKAASSGLSITYSRHPHDVAGMSTNRPGWASCMTMGEKGQVGRGDDYDEYKGADQSGAGAYSHYLKSDIEHGTHVAYLHRSDDPEMKKPLARIALKPFEADDPSKKTILRPEGRTYGTADDSFGKAVTQWSEKNFPVQKDTAYRKNDDLYDDDNRNFVGSPETLFNSKNHEYRRAAFHKDNDVSDELIHKGIKDKDIFTAEKAMQHPNAKLEHVDAGINNPNLSIAIANRKDLKPEHVAKLAKSRDASVLIPLLKNNKLTTDQLDKFLNHNSTNVRTAAVENQDLSPEQLDKASRDKEFFVRGAAASNPKASDETLSRLMKDSPFVVRTAVKNPNINEKHLMDYLNNTKRTNAYGSDGDIFNHPKFNSSHLDRAIQGDQPEDARKLAMEHPLITPEHLQKMAATDPDDKIKARATRFLKSKFGIGLPKKSKLKESFNGMFNFREFITEDKTKPDSKTLHAFDMDETLFAHDNNKLRVHVLDQNGRRAQSLTNQEFNTHKLAPGQKYDFSEFRSSDVFTKSAHPIRKMIAKLKAIQKNGGKTAIVTARSDLDDQPKFARHMGKYGIDIDKTHVHRAGNMEGKPADTKAALISGLIDQHGHKKVHLYDDSVDNLKGFLKLSKQHPDVELHAHHVQHDPETGNVNISTTSAMPKEPKNAKV